MNIWEKIQYLVCSSYFPTDFPQSLNIGVFQIILWKKEAMEKLNEKLFNIWFFPLKHTHIYKLYYKLSTVFHVLKSFSNSRIASMDTFIKLNNKKQSAEKKKVQLVLCFSIFTLDSILPE